MAASTLSCFLVDTVDSVQKLQRQISEPSGGACENFFQDCLWFDTEERNRAGETTEKLNIKAGKCGRRGGSSQNRLSLE